MRTFLPMLLLVLTLGCGSAQPESVYDANGELNMDKLTLSLSDGKDPADMSEAEAEALMQKVFASPEWKKEQDRIASEAAASIE